jgi:Leucine-rich repeat (LRR) protein
VFNLFELLMLRFQRCCASPKSAKPPKTHTHLYTSQQTKQNKTKQSTTLEELYLTRTRLTGPLPDAVPKDSRLRVLYAWNADIDSGAPWRGGGAFTGAVPPSLAGAASLTDLVLPYHNLTSLPEQLGGALYWLDVRGNQLESLPGACAGCLLLLLDFFFRAGRLSGRKMHTLFNWGLCRFRFDIRTSQHSRSLPKKTKTTQTDNHNSHAAGGAAHL